MQKGGKSLNFFVQNCCLGPSFERGGRVLVIHQLVLCTGLVLIPVLCRNVHASEGPGSGEDTFAFTAAGSKEMQQDLIENIYLTVLLTAVFFFFLSHL